jgi:hypothetical protein
VATPRSLQDWKDVESESDFISYLNLLVADARDPAAGRWPARDVPEFFSGWARWIDDSLANGTHKALLDGPSRRALAGQLFHARQAGRARTAADDSVVDDPEDVASAADLAGWLRYLADDCRKDDESTRRVTAGGGWAEGEWAHGTDLPGYLEAWQSCLEDHRAARHSRFKARTWAEIADSLEAGKVYE